MIYSKPWPAEVVRRKLSSDVKFRAEKGGLIAIQQAAEGETVPARKNEGRKVYADVDRPKETDPKGGSPWL